MIMQRKSNIAIAFYINNMIKQISDLMRYINIYKKQSKNNIMYDDYRIVTTKYKIMTKKYHSIL